MSSQKYISFNYNVNDINQSFLYYPDQNGNISSFTNPAISKLYDDNGNHIGHVQFQDNSLALESTKNFENTPQLVYEVAVFNIIDKGSIIYNYAFVSSSNNFSNGTVVPTIVASTDGFYGKADKIAIDSLSNGSRKVWVTLLD